MHGGKKGYNSGVRPSSLTRIFARCIRHSFRSGGKLR
jgi:hypothetical protein